ncbi:cytochrome P450 [Hypomontagnella monticulosa]|nr:cytochrome P450 [Hypomontagnella monticulosa]
METFTNQLSGIRVVTAIVAYFITLVLYRLFFHPLARFPGPRLAAISRWYEAYYDVVQNGQYTFKIKEMHRKYGPIVRISPHELHIHDADFYDKLYCQDGRWNKYSWAVDAFANYGAGITTADHDLHRIRRQPLNHFFSKARVASRQGIIRKHLDTFIDRLTKLAGSKVDLGAATTAFSRDLAIDFITGKTYGSLEKEDFDVSMLRASQGSGSLWRISKHVRWFAPLFKSIPPTWAMKIADNDTKMLFGFFLRMQQDTQDLIAAESQAGADLDGERPPNLVHQIIHSQLPPSEKTFGRVFDEVATVSGAGFETTASALRLIFFHLFSNRGILNRLRAEIASARAQSQNEIGLKELELLPYLTSIIMEGLRLSPGVASRLARVSPDKDLHYQGWRIPAGTPVGMTTILLHTDEKLYPEPRQFKPDRWMNGQKRAQKLFAPFSRGTRICLGMHLAWAELYLAVATLAERFDFQFEGATAEDFECSSDQFAVGTESLGFLKATVSLSTESR